MIITMNRVRFRTSRNRLLTRSKNADGTLSDKVLAKCDTEKDCIIKAYEITKRIEGLKNDAFKVTIEKNTLEDIMINSIARENSFSDNGNESNHESNHANTHESNHESTHELKGKRR